MIAWPGVAPRVVRRAHDDRRSARNRVRRLRRRAACTARTASRSVPLLDGTATSVREWALCGVWGREVHVIDATRTFAKSPVGHEPPAVDVVESMVDDADPRAARLGLPESRSPRPCSTPMPGSDVPVIRQPFDPSDDLPYWALGTFAGDLLYDHRDAGATECAHRASTPRR